MASTAPAAKGTRTRTPSPFTPQTRVTVSTHNDIDGSEANTSALGELLKESFEGSGFAVRLVSRIRKNRKTKSGQTGTASGPSSLMVYVAPSGFKFATVAERGVRLDSETAKLLRSVAEKMGLDPNDPASIVAVAKALAQKANA
jgi:hypothetical protein